MPPVATACAMSPKPLFWQATATPDAIYSPELGLASFTGCITAIAMKTWPQAAIGLSVIEDVMKKRPSHQH
jgi:hypothetical protein